MQSIFLNCGQHHRQYRIIAECGMQQPLALAGFCAEEQTENLIFKHLQNLCVQSDGSLSNTHNLLYNMMQQWESTFNIPALQILQHVTTTTDEKLKSVCLYKSDAGEQEKLINRILL